MIDPITDIMIVGQALEAMCNVVDPELGIDVVALGLIYDVDVADGQITVSMTLTTPGCPVSEQLPAEVATAVATALPMTSVDVQIVWDPPWTPERMRAGPLSALSTNVAREPDGTVVGVRHRYPGK
jgi:metal-sulfur cluster biosynthetic enzyme